MSSNCFGVIGFGMFSMFSNFMSEFIMIREEEEEINKICDYVHVIIDLVIFFFFLPFSTRFLFSIVN